ncbi:MAG TPA: hypothetical protein VN634_19160 [Candidatus Limnocylindrales bacterium]|nr:hypothetical protein [Candidatus Limnocylindrales bacterium]
MKIILAAALAALFASPAWAGGTSIKGSLVSAAFSCDTANPCQSGNCLEGGASCSTNSDCNICGAGSLEHCDTNADCIRGTVSPKSKVQISGNGRFKASLTGVTGADGQLLTTDGVLGSADDYLVVAIFVGYDVYAVPVMKIDFKGGKGKVDVDLGNVITGDSPINVMSVILFTPPDVPADCPGTNSPEDLSARLNDADCANGLPLAIMGLLPGQ